MPTLSRLVIMSAALLLCVGAVRADETMTIGIAVTAGAAGHGHVKWIARTTDASSQRCGRRDRRGLANHDSVRVFADSRCVGRPH